MMARWLAWLACVVLLAGCTGTSPRPSFWQLEPVAGMPAGWKADAPAVFLGAVGIPRYLDRPEGIERRDPSRLTPLTFDRWAEPLEDAVNRLLAEELARRLASERVVSYPVTARFPVDYHVVVDLDRLDGRPADAVQLVGRWSVLDGIGGAALATAREDIRVEAGEGTAGLVRAHEQALGELAARIVAGISGLPEKAAD